MKHWLVCGVSCLLWTCCASQGGCEEPPDIDFGEIVSDEKVNYQEHDRIQYRCYDGYALEGSEWISCNGQRWTSPPRCLAPCSITRQQLDAKKLLLSSGRRHSQVIRSNHTLEFMCREGYVITTPSVRKCADGHMSLPSCISERGKNCSRPPTIENGDIITLFQKEYPSGSWVEFKCQQYYAMEGHNRSICNNGTWTKVPACLEPCVIALTESQQIMVKGSSYDSGFQTTFLKRGDSVELSCKPGYVLETNPSQSAFLIQCNEEPIVYPKCKEVTCSPPQVTNGTFRPQRKVYQGGDLIHIQCNHGLQLENRQNIVECTSNGWSPSPQCEKMVCSPPEVGNGRLSPRQSQYRNEDQVRIQCEPGYQLERGGETSKCTEAGWSPPPQCIKKPCDVPTVNNGRLTDSYSLYASYYFPRKVGETVDYRCNDGFLSINKNYWHRSTCTDVGWDPEPQCFKKCVPPSLPHGRLIYSYWNTPFIEENEISFSCDEGYHPVPPEAKTKCTEDGWAPTPRCAGLCKATEAEMQSHNIQFKRGSKSKLQTEAGDVIEFACRRGFRAAPSSPPFTVQCIDGHFEYPRCIKFCTASEQTMRKNNIQFKQTSERRTQIPVGDVVEFTCLAGYSPAPSSHPFSVQCSEGNLEYPRCTRMYG